MSIKTYFSLPLIVLFFVDIHPAYAYIDPGTGSALLQSVIASISVGAAVIWGFRNKFSLLFKRILGRDSSKKISTKSPAEQSDNKDE